MNFNNQRYLDFKNLKEHNYQRQINITFMVWEILPISSFYEQFEPRCFLNWDWLIAFNSVLKPLNSAWFAIWFSESEAEYIASIILQSEWIIEMINCRFVYRFDAASQISTEDMLNI